MFKLLGIFIMFFSYCAQSAPCDLLCAYEQAFVSDPVFQQAVTEQLATDTSIAISLADLLPQVMLTKTADDTKLNLTVTQTIFDFVKFTHYTHATILSKQARANLNAAVQNLMQRVASAYFAVLEATELLQINKDAKKVYHQQLTRMTRYYHAKLCTRIDVNLAQTAYHTAVISYLNAASQLIRAQENLSAMTGKYTAVFPLLTNTPTRPLLAIIQKEKWVEIALKQNWQIKAAQYHVQIQHVAFQQSFANHLPTLEIQNKALNLAIPLFSGGKAIAETRQAGYQYQLAQQKLEQTIREITHLTRQTYEDLLVNLAQLPLDKNILQTEKRTLADMKARYAVGLEKWISLLAQEQRYYQAKVRYTNDRYTLMTRMLTLKWATGTLGIEDLKIVNRWLESTKNV